MSEFLSQLEKVKKSSEKLAALSSAERARLILEVGKIFRSHQNEILRANQKDLKLMDQSSAMRERLELNSKKIQALVSGITKIAKLPDVLGHALEQNKLSNGLLVKKIAVPLGVVAVIYESRPNVTADLTALAFKSGNALVLKGGKESYQTNSIMVKLVHKVLKRFGLPQDLIYLIDPKTSWQKELFQAHGLVDVIIPRGGEGLIRFVRENSQIPVIETGAGVCHTFVDESFNLQKTVAIIINAKTQRPSVCNSLDTLVLHEKSLHKLLPALAASLAEFRVTIKADFSSFEVLKKYYPTDLLQKAVASDYGKEFLSLQMAIKTVKNFEHGLDFVKYHTSGHSEALISKSKKHLDRFLKEVDAAVVYTNASTRFTDGEEFGMGAEVGISTQKLHVRGPMGAQALTSYKWIVLGRGQIRQ